MTNEQALIGFRDTVRAAGCISTNGCVVSPPEKGDSPAHRGHGRVLLHVLRRAVTRAARRLRLWRRHRAETREFIQLSDRELRDFGASRYDVEFELRKALWRQW
jgi:uncharacterized protein YjiS (DUF1127 family)